MTEKQLSQIDFTARLLPKHL